MKHKIISLFIGVLLLGFAGCDTWEEDINVDKSRPVFDENMTPELFLTTCLNGIFHATGRGWHEPSWNVLMPLVEYHGKSRSLSQANRHRSWHDLDGNIWGPAYQTIKPIKHLRRAGIGAEDPRYEAVADIWESYIMYTITLMYGDLPYFGAVGEDLVFLVEYDKQAEIFPAIFNKLKNASDLIGDITKPIDATSDWIYGGDIQKWKKFANVLRFKAAVHYHNANPEGAKQVMQEIVENPDKYPMFESLDDNCNFNYDGVQRISPFYYNTVADEDNLLMSNVFIERMLSLRDPRIYVYAKPVQKVHTDPNINVLPSNKGVDKYIGHLYGITTSDGHAAIWNGGVEYSSRQTSDWFRPVDENFNPLEPAKTTPLFLSHYPELLFLKAEAAYKGWISGNPKELYEAAIQASLEMFDATFSDDRYSGAYAEDALDDFSAFISQQQVNWDGGRSKELLIAEQKWIACYQLMFEPYFDHRRTMLPQLRASHRADSYESSGCGTRFPARADYPSSELQKNFDAVTKANNESFDIVVTGSENRTEAKMWLINNDNSPSLQMPIFQEPLIDNEEYPGMANFKTWYDTHWTSMFWWENE
jgi:hypothetical protein